jgi:nicotinamide phosphoribosyltransferase
MPKYRKLTPNKQKLTMRNSILFLTDSYKVSHFKQYPADTQTIYSYLESRGGKWQDTVFFGLQYFLKEYLVGKRISLADIDYAESRFKLHFGGDVFNRDGWQYILEKHGGRLPVSIWAMPEGTPVPTGHPLIVIYNTDSKCWWLTNYLETLLVQTWYPSTVATQSREMKYLILKYLQRTGIPEAIDFKLHDFGFRGVTCPEQAGLGGMSHLVNFKGTDTIAALEFAKQYYGEDMAGFSIPAAEHSTITSWGKENEHLAFKNMLEQYPNGLVACVSDSYNIFEACREKWGMYPLRDMILNRDGTLVVRPDSGDPINVLVTGNNNVLDILWERFGGIINGKGYKVLDDHVRIIQGDGVNIETIDSILYAMQTKGYSADNIAFGSGGALLQILNRDTQKIAFKCSAAQINGEWQDVWKDPVTDHGKQSKRGKVLTFRSKIGGFRTINDNYAVNPHIHTALNEEWQCGMNEVFRNGEILKEYTFEEVRNNAK